MMLSSNALASGSIGVWGNSSPSYKPTADLTDTRRPHSEEGSWQDCVIEILRAEQQYNIPKNYLLAIALTESGRRTDEGSVAPWPWTVNAEGVGRYFETKTEALEWVRDNQRQGKTSIDIGCMQINLRWHPKAFESVSSGFIPSVNVDYSARLLKSLYDDHGQWDEAIGRYHSHTSHLKKKYSTKVENNLQFIQTVKDELLDKGRDLPIAESGSGNIPESGPLHNSLLQSGWFSVAKADGNSGNLFANSLFKPFIPEYE